MKILFTGFEAFGKDRINSTAVAVSELANQTHRANIIVATLPVVRYEAIDAMINLINVERPDVAVSLGQASGCTNITPERIAINIDDYHMADNAGNQSIDTKIIDGAPDAYFSTLPIKTIVENLRKHNIPASVSNTAGTFICNHLFYGIQHYLMEQQLPIRHGFVHVPCLPSQVLNNSLPSMSLALIVEGLMVIADTLCDCHEDTSSIGGTTC